MTLNEYAERAVRVTVLDKLRAQITITADPIAQPEQYARDIHRAWKDAGGTIAGKPRHSDRFLVGQLREHGLEVRSITPKLVGRTRMKPDDASVLIRHFLANWPQKDKDAEGSETDAVKYVPLLPSEDISEVASIISEQIVRSVPPGPTEGSATVQAPLSPPGADIGAILSTIYAESDALFTVGTERPLVTQQPRTELLGFRNLINAFRDIESDGHIRPLVWVLDMGRQVFDERDLEARQRYLGVQALVTRFKSLRLFEDRGREERWEWLRSRAFFTVLDTKFEQKVDMAGVKRPNFLPHHISFSAIAPRWAMNSNFRALYGSEFERLAQRSFSVAFSGKGWPKSPADEDEDEFADIVHRRYFGYAQFAQDPSKQNSEKVGRGLELPSPGASYEEAYSTMYAAAVEQLKVPNKSEGTSVSGREAVAQLRFLGFRLLSLDEFMTF